MKKNKRLAWHLCIAAMILLSVLAFTPLIIPEGTFSPTIAGVPRTIWAGIALYIVMVVITYIGTRVHPDNKTDRGETV